MFKHLKKKKNDVGLLELSLVLLFFIVFAVFINRNIFPKRNISVIDPYKSVPKSAKVNIEKSIFVENPTKEDIVELIDDIENMNKKMKESDLIDEDMNIEFRYILQNLRFKI